MARAKAAREALPPAPSAGTLSQVLANVEFRALWATEALSVAGDQLAKVALAIMVYTRTQSAFWAALVYAMTFLPALAGGLGLSQLADRCPRRTLLVSGALIQATFVGLMALPGMPLAVLCGLVFAVQLVAAPANAAQQAITRETFDSDMLYLRSQDLRGITTNTMMLVGLGGGGLLVTLIGTSWALVADATTFVVAAAILRRWVRQRTSAGGAADRWFDGVRHVFGDRRLRVLLALSWLVGLAVVPEGLAAPIADELGAPDQSVGWLLAADPLGFLIGAFLLSRYACPATRQRLVFGLSMCSVALLIGFVWAPNLGAALILLALSGAAGAYIITVTARFHTLVPNRVRGAASGVYRTGLRVAQGVGIALGGAVAQWLGSASTTVALAGAVGLVLAVVITLSNRGQS